MNWQLPKARQQLQAELEDDVGTLPAIGAMR